MFWVIAGAMAVVVAAALGLALRRGQTEMLGRVTDIVVYKDQLAAVERDVARGIVDPADADRLRTEIKRRILDADRAGQSESTQSAPGGATLAVAGVAGVVVVGGAMGLYAMLGAPGYPDLPLAKRLEMAEVARANRPDQATAENQLPPSPPPEMSDQHAELMQRLRDVLAERPDDQQGHELLARNEAGIGNFDAAWRALDRVIALKGDGATAEDFAGLGELMVLAAGGYVSPEAERALGQALLINRAHPGARYYIGLMHSQTGRPDLAFRFWEPLLRQSRSDDPWVEPIRGQIERMAALAGVDYSLPPLTALRGPTREDMEAAEDMSPTARMEMIRGMVSGLGERLANEGGTPDEWAQMIRALGVLGETGRAAAIWNEAQQVFPDPATRLPILRAARDAGVAQ
ncbi:MAG: c-type cytochrome biogenesis protein CcmI [Pseudomonadota bacterium]